MVTKIRARDATLKVETSTITPGGAALDTLFTGSAESIIKDVTVTPVEMGVDKIDCLGETSDFQNQYLDEKSPELASLSATAILDGGTVTPIGRLLMGDGSAVGGTHHIFQIGSSASGESRSAGAVLLNLEQGSDEVNIAYNNFYVTKVGDKKPTGMDGHFEMEFEGMCLAKDYYEEWKD